MSSIPAFSLRRLRGRCIFLSASVPSPEAEDDQFRSIRCFDIDQAVISLARAVFSEGGQLVFGGHPSISPLVAMVAGEYREFQYAERLHPDERPLVRIFQSRAFERHLPDETCLMFRLGLAQLEWTEAASNEIYNPEDPRDPDMQCPHSLRDMRTEMIRRTRPDAMVCIGGMGGMNSEAVMFRELRRDATLYTLRKTGGEAASIASRIYGVRTIDSEVLEEIEIRRTALLESHGELPENRDPDDLPITPYPLIMQTIVDQLANTHLALRG